MSSQRSLKEVIARFPQSGNYWKDFFTFFFLLFICRSVFFNCVYVYKPFSEVRALSQSMSNVTMETLGDQRHLKSHTGTMTHWSKKSEQNKDNRFNCFVFMKIPTQNWPLVNLYFLVAG